MLVTTYMIAQCHNSEDQSPYFNFLRNLKPHTYYYFSVPKVIQLTGSSNSFIPCNYFCAYEFCHFPTFNYPDLLHLFCKTIQKFWYSMHLTYSATRKSPASPFDEQACGWMSSHHTYRWRVQRDCFLATSVGCAWDLRPNYGRRILDYFSVRRKTDPTKNTCRITAMHQQKHYNISASNTTSFQIRYKTTSYWSRENIKVMNSELKILTFFI